MIRHAGPLLLIVASACGWSETADSPERSRGVPRGAERPSEPTAAPVAPVADARPTPPPPPPPPAPTAPTAPEEPEPERDYGAEIVAQMGSPVECLKSRKAGDAPPELRVELEAYLMPTGLISRGYARSAELGTDELDCIRRRLEAQRLAAPIEEAPRQVRATIRLSLKPPETPQN